MQPPARGVADGYAASPPLAASSLGCAQVIRFPPRSLVWLLARGLRFPAPANLCMHLPVSIRSHSPASLPCRPVKSQVRWNWAACASERGVRGGGARKPAQHVPPLEGAHHPSPDPAALSPATPLALYKNERRRHGWSRQVLRLEELGAFPTVLAPRAARSAARSAARVRRSLWRKLPAPRQTGSWVSALEGCVRVAARSVHFVGRFGLPTHVQHVASLAAAPLSAGCTLHL